MLQPFTKTSAIYVRTSIERLPQKKYIPTEEVDQYPLDGKLLSGTKESEESISKFLGFDAAPAFLVMSSED